MGTSELLAMKVAYEALAPLDKQAWKRALRWIESRLASDERTRSAQKADGIEPETWVLSGSMEGSEEGPHEVAQEFAEYGEVTEIDGLAVVRRKFAVPFQTEDGQEIDMFDDRGEAEAFLASLSDDPVCAESD